MDIYEFVKDIIIDLDKAVEEARKITSRDIHFHDKGDQRTLEFDIAVAVDSADSTNGKVGISVLKFFDAGGGVNSEIKNSTVSRIKFGVHIDAKTKGEKNSLRPGQTRDRMTLDQM